MFSNLTPTSKITHWGPKKTTLCKNRSNSKDKLEGSIENKSCSAIPADHKNVF